LCVKCRERFEQEWGRERSILSRRGRLGKPWVSQRFYLSSSADMKILSIETSCDETAVALLEISGDLNKPDIQILGNSLFSQSHLHEPYGGVYPNLAKREHQKNLPILIERTLREAGCQMSDDLQPATNNIDYIAVTQGPGLEPALWVGITQAEELGRKWGKPVVPVDHMEGHIYSVLFNNRQPTTDDQQLKTRLELPALALLVSGGHTELVLVKGFGVYEILGRTRDDAVGEAFDKVARMLDLPYPGGPGVSALASETRARQGSAEPMFKLPRPMIHSQDLDFSYSGLKTAVLYKVKELGTLTDEMKGELARAFEDAAIEVLVSKTRRALEQHTEVRSLIVGGGVSANTHLVSELGKLVSELNGVTLLVPSKELTTDNAIMIGIAAFIKIQLNTDSDIKNASIEAKGNLSL
jgi:N6-L-threonylcarbamoyladenine synthase